MSSRTRLHPAGSALVAALALSACGGHEAIRRSDRPAATASPAPSRSATPAAAQRATDGTFKGQDIVTRFGDVQVAVVLAGGHITDVEPVTLPTDRPRSQYISQAASPILRNEVLNAQSARINLVSGATYTSDAWAASVQSALDRAR